MHTLKKADKGKPKIPVKILMLYPCFESDEKKETSSRHPLYDVKGYTYNLSGNKLKNDFEAFKVSIYDDIKKMERFTIYQENVSSIEVTAINCHRFRLGITIPEEIKVKDFLSGVKICDLKQLVNDYTTNDKNTAMLANNHEECKDDCSAKKECAFGDTFEIRHIIEIIYSIYLEAYSNTRSNVREKLFLLFPVTAEMLDFIYELCAYTIIKYGLNIEKINHSLVAVCLIPTLNGDEAKTGNTFFAIDKIKYDLNSLKFLRKTS